MKKLNWKTKLLAAAIVLILLALTNPSPNSYKQYVHENITSKMIDKVPSGSKGAVAGEELSPAFLLINAMIETTTRRDNYGLFSVYVTRFYDRKLGFLGVFGHFFALN